ncbi:MAG: hypothetical protein J2P36_26775, partial [Ktedonobacteraceae bacterium]|nr:hypothetical protein [Ktedonobacteraceae bacterium]
DWDGWAVTKEILQGMAKFRAKTLHNPPQRLARPIQTLHTPSTNPPQTLQPYTAALQADSWLFGVIEVGKSG